MSIIDQLKISSFRNLKGTALELSSQFNVFHGDNGAGKTSLLEAIYYLSTGKSFRGTNANGIIQRHAEEFFITGRVKQSNIENLAGIACSSSKSRQIKLNGEALKSIAPITRLAPIQFMSPMSYRFFHDGPKIRRQYLDWALFHVKHDFLETWRVLQRALKQRNSALKQQQSTLPWDEEFIQVANVINQMRSDISEELTPLCLEQLEKLLPEYSFCLEYQRGWSNDKALENVLKENRLRDRQLGYTYFGPQRADIQLLLADKPVQDVLSQGQQKLAAYALHLSLGALLHQKTKSSPIYLIDDLPSELDSNSREKIVEVLKTLGAQAFITGISAKDLAVLQQDSNTRMFHVEQGNIQYSLSSS